MLPPLLLITALCTLGVSGSNCPESKVSSCFQAVFALDLSHSCDYYDYLESCFQYSECSEEELTSLAAKEYMNRNRKLMPKEVLLTLRAQLKLKCSNDPNAKHCGTYQNVHCWTKMTREQRTVDDSFQLELEGQFQQFELKIVSQNQGCRTSRSTLNRWVHYRLKHCGAPSGTCLCNTYKAKLELLRCAVKCVASTSNYSPNTSSMSTRFSRNTNTGAVAGFTSAVSLTFVVLLFMFLL